MNNLGLGVNHDLWQSEVCLHDNQGLHAKAISQVVGVKNLRPDNRAQIITGKVIAL